MRSERLFLEDIALAADAITEHIRGVTFEEFARNRMLRGALSAEFTIIGEAIARLSPALRARHSEVPWADVKAFRNVIVHAYFGLDLSDVWESATRDIPVLRPQIAAIIEAEFPAEAPPPKAVCLLSGGLDSATCLALARRDGYQTFALSFDYGQRHRVELEAAARIAAALGAERHVVARIGLDVFGGSALTDSIDVPKGRSAAAMSDGIPVTYVPARNTIFLSFALAWAETLGTGDIFIGVNALDYSGYPDCRPEYIDAYQRMANLATKAGVEGTARVTIHTPLLRLSKAEIVVLGRDLGVPFGLTHSCYDPSPDGRPCGECDSCVLRRKGFEEAGVEDR